MPTSKRRQPRRRKGPTPKNRGARGASDDRAGASSWSPSEPARASTRSEPTPASARYTPKLKNRGLFRPTWHKVVGALMIVLGITLFVLNDLAWFDVNVMPGGHNELYAVLAVLVAASSLWWFGAFDRPPERR